MRLLESHLCSVTLLIPINLAASSVEYALITIHHVSYLFHPVKFDYVQECRRIVASLRQVGNQRGHPGYEQTRGASYCKRQSS